MNTPLQTKISAVLGLLTASFIFSATLFAQNCNNVTDGGLVCCSQTSSISPYDPNPIVSLQEASGGGNTPIEYMWMYTNNPYNTVFSTWNGIPNSNSPSLDPGPITTTTFYVRCARRVGCPEFIKESNVVVVTVEPCNNLNTGGKIAANQSGCGAPFDPQTLYSVQPASGSVNTGAITYSWYKSNVLEIFNLSTGNWTLIANANGDSHDPDVINQTTYYVRLAKREGCPTSFASNILKVELFPAVKTQATVKNPLCSGDSNGSILLTVTNGTGPYTVKWADPQVPINTLSLFNLKAGIYSYTVTDANACQEFRQIDVLDPLPLEISIKGTDVRCYGNNDGYASVQASGGTLPYSYLWSNQQTTASISGLSPGIYSITVTDANACSKTAQVIVSQPGQLTAMVNHTDVSCFAQNDGSAVVTASGGVFPYAYLWSDGKTDATISDLAAGNYSITVTDKNNCQVVKPVQIIQPDSLKVTAIVVNNKCFGNAEGSISVSASGGSGVYTYSWSNSGNSPTISALTAGSYTLTLTDANDCSLLKTFVVTEPQNLNVSVNSVSVTCNGDKNGAASVTISGGTAPYSVIWSNGATTSVISNLLAGDYSVTVTDANLCSAARIVKIEEPESIFVQITVADERCTGDKNGSASITVNGGTAPYSILWSTGQTGTAINNLAAGSYSATVTDANQCLKMASFTVKPAVTVVLQFTTEQVRCFGTATGKIFTTVTGAYLPVEFLWSNGSTDKDLVNLTAGTYTLTVTDGRGCTQISSAFVAQPSDALKVNISINEPLCNGGTGSAAAVVSGGTSPYKYYWSSGQTTSSVSGLTAAAYSLTVVDANNCSERTDFTIGQPQPVRVNINRQDVSCFGYQNGIAGAIANGGKPPYSFLWSNGQQTATISGLSAGQYGVTVSDSNGCSTQGAIVIQEPLQLIISAVGSATLCYGDQSGSVSVGVLSGGIPPFSYLWSNGATTSSQTSVLPAGTYQVTVTDANGCFASTSATVTQSPQIILTTRVVNAKCRGAANGSATVDATGGTGSYVYLWSNGATTSTNNQLAAGTYTVTVTDSNGCSKSATVIVLQPDGFSLSILKKEISCHNGQNGSAFAFTSGSPFGQVGFLWSNGETGSSVSNLAAGSYSVTATDENGCTATADFVLSNPSRIDFTLNVTNIPCNGNGKASATIVNLNGGLPPYHYNWSEGSTTASVTQLSEGGYSVTVTDANNCTAVKSFVVTQAPALFCQADILSPVTTYNGNQASAKVTVSGGVQPYSYQWSNGETTATISGLKSGIYIVVVSDGNGCTCTSLVKIANKSRIGNFVWEDSNGDGIQQSAESGLANIKVVLSGEMLNGTPVNLTQYTDAFGNYVFDGLMAGKYKLTFDPPSGYNATQQNIGSDDADSDISAVSGMTGVYDLADGESNLTVDAGFVKAGKLGDRVWFDKNKNGIQDSGEPGFANIMVKLFFAGPDNIFRTADDVLLQTTNSDNSGNYYFANIVHGQQYMVQFDINSVPAGYVFTTANAGSDDSKDSDADASGFSHIIILPVGQAEDLNIDAGLFTPCLNVDEGGLIGPREQTICGAGIVSPFYSTSPASGGSNAPIEYLWLKSTTNPFFVPNSSDWMPIPGSNSETLSPGLVSVTTYYIRCARRQGCDPYTAESNIVTVFVNPIPIAQITTYPKVDVCALTSIGFSAADAGIGATYNWNFGANSIPQQTGGISASAFFNSTGTYKITLTVAKLGCSSKHYVDVNVVNCPGVSSRFGFSEFKMTTIGTEKVALNWKTSDLRFDNIFLVEHSKNGIDFNSIGTVKARDLMNSGFYTFDDYNPSLGYNYYRIRHIDYFGASVYSDKLNNFVTIASALKEAAVYPNPVTDFVRIEIPKNRTAATRIDVLSVYGQVINTYKLASGEDIRELDLTELQSGYYYIRLDFGNDKFETHKIIVQKK